jgi:hypothetical protein
MENKTYRIAVKWKHHRRASASQEERGKLAALNALSNGKSHQQAAQACVEAMFAGRTLLFDDFTVMIDGQPA